MALVKQNTLKIPRVLLNRVLSELCAVLKCCRWAETPWCLLRSWDNHSVFLGFQLAFPLCRLPCSAWSQEHNMFLGLQVGLRRGEEGRCRPEGCWLLLLFCWRENRGAGQWLVSCFCSSQRSWSLLHFQWPICIISELSQQVRMREREWLYLKQSHGGRTGLLHAVLPWITSLYRWWHGRCCRQLFCLFLHVSVAVSLDTQFQTVLQWLWMTQV